MRGDPVPVVSVVLATSRVSQYLQQALVCLRAQTFADWELVVVDDGSPDPQALERDLASVPRHSVVRQRNLGVAVARNVGCAAARGAYLTFLDDDDYWPERRLELQLAQLAERPELVGVFGRVAYVDADGKELGLGPDCSSHDARIAAGFSFGTLLLRRDAGTQTGGFDPRLRAAEDTDFSLRLARVGELGYVPEILLYYRRHADNVTNAAVHHRYGREVAEHHYRLCELSGDDVAAVALAEMSRAVAAHAAIGALRAALNRAIRGHPVEALAAARTALDHAGFAARFARRVPRRRRVRNN